MSVHGDDPKQDEAVDMYIVTKKKKNYNTRSAAGIQLYD